MKTYTYKEKLFIKAQRNLIKLHVQREEARNAGLDDRDLTRAMLSQKARVNDIKGQLIEQRREYAR